MRLSSTFYIALFITSSQIYDYIEKWYSDRHKENITNKNI